MNTRSFLAGCLLIAALFSTPSPVSAQDDASIKQAVAAAESFPIKGARVDISDVKEL